MKISVLLADDHQVMRDGLRTLLQTQPDICVVGESGDGRETVRLAELLRPNIVLLDIAMPWLNGIEAARRIRSACPDVRVVVLSMYSTNEHVCRALHAGAAGFLLKECAGQEVIEAIRAVKAGRRFLSAKLPAAEIDAALRVRVRGKKVSPVERLSPREREVLQLVVEGKSSAAIAKLVFLSPKTVETYRSRLMKKLGVRDLAGLVKYAVANGLTA